MISWGPPSAIIKIKNAFKATTKVGQVNENN